MKILGIESSHEYDSVLYIDGSIQVIGSLEHTITQFLKSGAALGLFAHNDRISPWEELIACNELGYLSEDEYSFEEARLKAFEGGGIELGLFDAGVIIKNPRRESLAGMSKMWFDFFVQNPARDQLSLPIVVSEYEEDVFRFEHWRRSYNATFLRYPHKEAESAVKFFFWLGSICPRLFHITMIFARRQRQRLGENLIVRMLRARSR